MQDQRKARGDMSKNKKSLYGDPIETSAARECVWYHSFDFPDHETVKGRWDFRGKVDDHFNNYNFADKRVLEIGPASGFLTVSMEERGAKVVAIDTSDDQVWDVVPRLDIDASEFESSRQRAINRLRASWWYSQKRTSGAAKIAYCGAHNVRDQFGRFDCTLFSSILQHLKNPYEILAAAARISNDIIVTELYWPRLETGLPIAEFAPRPDNDVLDSWWTLSTKAVQNMLETLNFELQSSNTHKMRRYEGNASRFEDDGFTDYTFFTHVYSKL